MTDIPPDAKASGNRKTALLALAAVVVIAGAAWAVYDFIIERNIVSTNDAYVSGDVVQITSEVPGTVIALKADDTQAVKQGQSLIELDRQTRQSRCNRRKPVWPRRYAA